MKRRRFTNTALPVFSGAECWFQHFHIVQAIVEKWACPGNGSIEINPLEHPGVITNSCVIRKLVEWEPLEHPVPSVTLCWGSEPPIADVQEEPEEGEAIVVGAVGSATF